MSSRPFAIKRTRWEACRLFGVENHRGVLHVHMNVEEERIEAWTNQTVDRFRNMVEVHHTRL